MTKSNVEGEGSYKATRRYDKKVGKFVHDRKSEIPRMAKDAEKAIEGPEGDELRRAEEIGKSKARH
ncbi:MAG TPA: hypothetical protein VMD53_06015 [Rhizomicrobium sp.]|nr:hypothetical protein [Rhizomicrobium sp.]